MRSGVVVPSTIRSISRGVDAGGFQRPHGGVVGEVAGGLAFGGDVPLADAGAGDDPLVAGVDELAPGRRWSAPSPAGSCRCPRCGNRCAGPGLAPMGLASIYQADVQRAGLLRDRSSPLPRQGRCEDSPVTLATDSRRRDANIDPGTGLPVPLIAGFYCHCAIRRRRRRRLARMQARRSRCGRT